MPVPLEILGLPERESFKQRRNASKAALSASDFARDFARDSRK
jgi:hypothetical protein